MKLEVGKSYLTSDKKIITVAGFTKKYPGYVWTLQGDWFIQETGQRISSTKCTVDEADFTVGGIHYKYVPCQIVAVAEHHVVCDDRRVGLPDRRDYSRPCWAEQGRRKGATTIVDRRTITGPFAGTRRKVKAGP